MAKNLPELTNELSNGKRWIQKRKFMIPLI